MGDNSKCQEQENIRHEKTKDEFLQIFEQILDDRVERYLEINHQGIIGNHYFAAASSECIDLYRDGHFISAVMVSHSVNEGIIKFLAERNEVKGKKSSEVMDYLFSNGVITEQCKEASIRIWNSFRNDVHHMNPNVTKIPFRDLAKRNLQDLATVEREIFGVDFDNGKLIPKNPQYWDIQKDGTVLVFLRLGG